MDYLAWLEYRKSPAYVDVAENHFGAVQLEPITAYVKGMRAQISVAGPNWDQLIRVVTWKDIDREALDGLPGTRMIVRGHVECYHWIKKHVIASPRRQWWLEFLSWRNHSLYQELERERMVAAWAKHQAEVTQEQAERKAEDEAEAQRQAEKAANHPLAAFSSGKITRRNARILID